MPILLVISIVVFLVDDVELIQRFQALLSLLLQIQHSYFDALFNGIVVLIKQERLEFLVDLLQMQAHHFLEEHLLVIPVHVLPVMHQQFLCDELEGEVKDDHLITGDRNECLEGGMFVFGVVSS